MTACNKCGANCELSPRVSKAAEPMDLEQFLRMAVEVERLANEAMTAASAEHLSESEFKKLRQIQIQAGVIERKAWAQFPEQERSGLQKKILMEQIIRDPSRLDKMSFADIAALEV